MVCGFSMHKATIIVLYREYAKCTKWKAWLALGTSLFCFFSFLFFFPAILFFPTYYAQNFAFTAHQKFYLLAKSTIVIIKYNAYIYNITVNDWGLILQSFQWISCRLLNPTCTAHDTTKLLIVGLAARGNIIWVYLHC